MSEEIKEKMIKKQEHEIDLIALVERLWQKRKFIIIVTGCFMTIGLVVAIFSPKVYTSSCTFVPQSSRRASSSVSSLAALAGINLGDMTNNSAQALSPMVYPQILDNANFQKDLMYSKIKFNEWDEPITLIDYYTNPLYKKFSLIGAVKKYTVGLPRLIIGAIKRTPKSIDVSAIDGTKLPSYTKEEYMCAKILKKNVKMDIEEKKGYITIQTSMYEPIASAQLTQTAFDLLQQYVTEFKIQKVKAQLDFIQRRFDETKADFENKQLALAEFQDANRVISSATARTKLEQLTSDYNVANTIYMEMAKQLLQAGIQVKEDTPILSPVKPVSVPYTKSKPKRAQILVIWTLLGGILSCGLVIGFDWLNRQGVSNLRKWDLLS